MNWIFKIPMTIQDKKELIIFFGSYMTDGRRELIDEKLDCRTKFITVALEDIYNSHNASAVMRSCDCFGIQDLHVVEQRNEYQLNPGVTMGSSKWINLHRYQGEERNNIEECYETLKSEGYKVLVTSPNPQFGNLKEYKLTEPVAIVFGTEMNGLSNYALENADEFLHIPMRGFTGSFNISVSAAICMYELTGKLLDSDLQWQLNETQKLNLKLEWYRKSVRRSKSLEDKFFRLREER